MKRDEMLGLLRDALKGSPADETELVASSGSSSLTRYANSVIHQNVHESNTPVVARVAVGKRVGVSAINSLDPEALRNAIARATEIARQSPEVPMFPGFPKAPRAPEVKAYSPATASMPPDARAEAVARAVAIAKSESVTLSGAYRVDARSLAVVNTSGTEQHYDATSASLSIFATAEDGVSGSARGYAVGTEGIDVEATTRQAVEKCKAAADPADFDPEAVDVILEPRATAEIMGWLGFTAFGAKQVQEGQSFLAGRIGQKVMGDAVTIYDDGFDPEGVPVPFDYEGVPKSKVTMIEAGVARGPVYDSLTAAKDGVPSTGHANTAAYRTGPGPSNIFIAPGDKTFDELMSEVKRGLLVTSFHYLNGLLDTRKALFTGMTRDGTFLVENGKIVKSVKNLRFTESMMRAFSNVAGLTKEREIVGFSWAGIASVTAPTILIRDFTFTGATEF